MKENTQFEVINPPNSLATKVSPTGGPNLETIVREAEEALEDLQESYVVWVRQDLEQLDKLLRQAQMTPDKAASKLKKIHQLSHDIKGQGATFQYPLLTHIAASLCTLLEDGKRSNDVLLALTRIHVDALTVVLKENIRGMGGAQGKQMVEMLRTAVDKVLTG